MFLTYRGAKMDITVYTLPNCVQCDNTKKMLDRENIEYETVDMSDDMQALEMVKGLGYSAAPVVIAGDEHWGGFRLEKIKALVSSLRLDTATH